MRYSSSWLAIAAAAAPFLVSAAPARFYGKRAASDILVYKFADVLEQLESTFYSKAIAKFTEADFTNAGYASAALAIEQFKIIQQDEATHSSVLQSALKSFGEMPITTCSFNFDSALTDVATMAATARVIELVGVSAYIGGATLMTDTVLLEAAAGILTIEARHQTTLNLLSGTGTMIPSAFDFALTPSEVLALASPFVSGCDLGIPANTPLTVTNTGSVAPGTLLTFSAPTINSTNQDSLFCQMLIGGSLMTIPLKLSECVVPPGINGPVAVFVTSDGQPLLNNVRDRDTSKQLAGPALAMIDTQPQAIGQLVRPSSGSGASSSSSSSSPSSSSSGSSSDAGTMTTTSTATISPAEASAILASAAATDSSAAAAPTDTAAASPSANAVSSGKAGGPNPFMGPSPDGKTVVQGWSNV